MNKQHKSLGQRGIEWTDYTWNPVGGCKHQCRWVMPDGSTAICYAEDVATKLRSVTFYRNGFEEHYWNPERLTEPLKLKRPARIFLDSMSDLMGHWVPDEQVEAVLAVARQAPQHTFQLLTKNAPRLRKFKFSPNVWVGVSAPPSSMMGHALSQAQQERWMAAALKVLADIDVPVRWMSLEPLSFDASTTLEQARALHPKLLQWAVIGAATNGSKAYQPDYRWVKSACRQLRLMRASIFFKGNLKRNDHLFDWVEEFPTIAAAPDDDDIVSALRSK